MSRYIGVERIGSSEMSSTGVKIQEFVDEHLMASCLGRVTYVPYGVPYYGDINHEIKKRYGKVKPQYVAAQLQRNTRKSIDHLQFVEIEVGDIVLFRYNHNLAGNEHIPYDSLIAKVNGDGTLFPLNGQLLLSMDKHVDEGIQVLSSRKYDNAMDHGTVIAEGNRVLSYLIYRGFDNSETWIGRKVFFRKGMAIRIEHDMNPQLEYQTPWPYYRLNRYNVLLYV